MAREFAEAFYSSGAWRKCRRSFIAERIRIDGGMCQECHKELGYIVHHKTWLTPDNINDPDVTLNHNNLKYVCLNCHNGIDKKNNDEPRYIFGPDGQIVPLPPKK